MAAAATDHKLVLHMNLLNHKLRKNYDKSLDKTPYVLKNDGSLDNFTYWYNILQQRKIHYADNLMLQQDPFDLYYEDEYKMIDYENYKKIIYEIQELYHKSYYYLNEDKSNLWMNENIPEIQRGIFFKKDYVFVQNVDIINENAKVMFIGDIHSSIHVLIDILYSNQHEMFERKSDGTYGLKLINDWHIIFFGDIVDRGPYGIELMTLIFKLKINNFDKVYIINGNHEDPASYSIPNNIIHYSYKIEILGQFNTTRQSEECLFSDMVMFSLPSAIFLNFNNKIYHLSHGTIDTIYSGWDNETETFDGINSQLALFLTNRHIKKFDLLSKKSDPHYYDSIKKNANDDRLNDFKWGDAKQNYPTIGIERSRGGEGLIYGADAIETYLNTFKFESLFSGHQDFVSVGLIKSSLQVKNIDKSNEYDVANNIQFILCPEAKNCLIAKNGPVYDFYIAEPINKNLNVTTELDPNHASSSGDFLVIKTSIATVKNMPCNEVNNIYCDNLIHAIYTVLNVGKPNRFNPMSGGYLQLYEKSYATDQNLYYKKYKKYKQKYNNLKYLQLGE